MWCFRYQVTFERSRTFVKIPFNVWEGEFFYFAKTQNRWTTMPFETPFFLRKAASTRNCVGTNDADGKEKGRSFFFFLLNPSSSLRLGKKERKRKEGLLKNDVLKRQNRTL